MLPTPTFEKALPRALLDVLIPAGLIAVLAIFCFEIVVPFLDLLVWFIILAITPYPLQVRLRRRLGNKDGRTATVIVLVAVAIIIVPTYLLGIAMGESVEHAMSIVKDEGFHISPRADSVAGWPQVGQRLHDFWLQAATDMTGLMQKLAPQIKDVSRALLITAAGLG